MNAARERFLRTDWLIDCTLSSDWSTVQYSGGSPEKPGVDSEMKEIFLFAIYVFYFNVIISTFLFTSCSRKKKENARKLNKTIIFHYINARNKFIPMTYFIITIIVLLFNKKKNGVLVQVGTKFSKSF